MPGETRRPAVRRAFFCPSRRGELAAGRRRRAARGTSELGALCELRRPGREPECVVAKGGGGAPGLLGGERGGDEVEAGEVLPRRGHRRDCVLAQSLVDSWKLADQRLAGRVVSVPCIGERLVCPRQVVGRVAARDVLLVEHAVVQLVEGVRRRGGGRVERPRE